MARDVISFVARDMKPLESDELNVLLVSTSGAMPAKVYRDLEVVRADFPDEGGKPSKIYRKVSQLFNQGKTTLAPALYRKVKIVGFPAADTPADLIDAIESYRQNDNEWQILLTDRDEQDFQEALIAFAESTEPTLAELMTGIEDNRKTYFGQSTVKEFVFEHPRGVIVWVNSLEEEGDAAIVGNVAPFYPRRVTWKFKEPQGVTVANLSDGEKDALDEQHINYVTKENGWVYLKEGVCTDGEFIDALLGADYCAKRIRDRVYYILKHNEDVPYDDDGFTLIGSGVTAGLSDALENRIIGRDPESRRGRFTVSIPTRLQATDDQARKRIMPDIHWTAVIEGATHRVVVRGVLTVSLALLDAA